MVFRAADKAGKGLRIVEMETGEITVMRSDGSEITALTDNPWEDATPRCAPLGGK